MFIFWNLFKFLKLEIRKNINYCLLRNSLKDIYSLRNDNLKIY